ncbi:MAG: hypothetical protein EZS28_043967 [Streblomastix strix]|uniref:Uncharacterized protein n=1 Tax=Streblomastix strix TaxID=222440 RepID=A0A5J4TQJ4_9EUKA|nr:MAG: hypothetical protein EZS28_043967 [Streblomastix strix]
MQKFFIIGEYADLIKIGGRMRKQRNLPPSERMIIAVIQRKVENNYSDGLYYKGDQIMKQSRELQKAGIAHGEDID